VEPKFLTDPIRAPHPLGGARVRAMGLLADRGGSTPLEPTPPADSGATRCLARTLHTLVLGVATDPERQPGLLAPRATARITGFVDICGGFVDNYLSLIQASLMLPQARERLTSLAISTA
jgi:hypothetical protein